MIVKKNKSAFGTFLKEIISSGNNVSAKRAITLAFGILQAFITILFIILIPVVIFMATKGDIEMVKIMVSFGNNILEKSFLIVMGGLGIMGGVDIATIFSRRSESPTIPPEGFNEYVENTEK